MEEEASTASKEEEEVLDLWQWQPGSEVAAGEAPYLLVSEEDLEERRPVHVLALSATSLATTHVPVKQGTKNDKPKPENNCASYWLERSYWQEETKKEVNKKS
jgi:hypothetical protein